METAAVQVDMMVLGVGGRGGGGGGGTMLLLRLLLLLLLQVMSPLLLVRIVGGRHRVARLGVLGGRPHVLDGVGHGGGRGCGGGCGCVSGARSPRRAEKEEKRLEGVELNAQTRESCATSAKWKGRAREASCACDGILF